MYKIIILLSLFFLSSFLLVGCTNSVKNVDNDIVIGSGKPKVAATIFPIYTLVQEVAGDKVDVNLILPSGASPHTFEVTTSQIRNLQDTKLIFANGQNLDNWAQNITSAISGTTLLDLSKSRMMMLKPFDNNNHLVDPDNVDGESFDPHYWLDPVNSVFIARQIAVELSILSPENEVYFNQRVDDYVDRIHAKELEWAQKLENLQNKDIVVFHDAWGYFADYFGFNIVATFEPFPGQEPSPQYLKELQNSVKENNIKTLFVEPQLSQNSIRTLASDLGVQIQVLDPLGGVEGRMSYIDLMDYNVNNVFNLLKNN
jgi:zinc transport system substrate-binding protein